MIARVAYGLLAVLALALPFAASWIVLSYLVEFVLARLVKTSPCTGCAFGRVPLVGPWYARRRRHIYCEVCMPELYR